MDVSQEVTAKKTLNDPLVDALLDLSPSFERTSVLNLFRSQKTAIRDFLKSLMQKSCEEEVVTNLSAITIDTLDCDTYEHESGYDGNGVYGSTMAEGNNVSTMVAAVKVSFRMKMACIHYLL